MVEITVCGVRILSDQALLASLAGWSTCAGADQQGGAGGCRVTSQQHQQRALKHNCEDGTVKKTQSRRSPSQVGGAHLAQTTPSPPLWLSPVGALLRPSQDQRQAFEKSL